MSAALFDAIRNQDLNAVQHLLQEHPEWVIQKDARGSTPLLLASYYGLEEITRCILSVPQPIDAQDASGNTALMGVSFKGDINIARLLIEHGADVNKTNFNKGSALIFASTFGRIELVKLLLDHGADKYQKDEKGFTAFDHAKMQGIESVLTLLQTDG
jgi:uncharacterized protein